ncbi:MAG: polysaccharide deacetylase family protein [Acidobacteriota bacterium]
MRAGAFAVLVLVANGIWLIASPPQPMRILVCVTVCVAGNAAAVYALLHPRSQLLMQNRAHVDCSRPCVALTFDDGPNSYQTGRLLDILREKNVRATFFIVGQRAAQQPDLMRRIVGDGHLVANHTYSHPPLFCFLSPGRLRDEIQRTQEALALHCGTRPRHFRSPVGLKHPLLSRYLARYGLEYVSWRLRTFDTIARKPANIVARVLARVQPGDIVLLHDNAMAASTGMLDVLPLLIDELRARGYEFVLV